MHLPNHQPSGRGGHCAVLVASGAAATVLAPSASATTQERATLQPDQTFELDYPALVGSGQAQETVDPTIAFDSATCESVTWCDTIPLTVAPPVTDLATSDYTIQIMLTWDTAVVAVPVQGNADSNDLDLAIWDDPVDPTAGPDQNGIRAISATGNVPEQMTLVNAAGNFHIVVVNASGVNRCYHLQIAWKTQLLSTPFESLPPDYSSTGTLAPPGRLSLGGSPTPGNVPAPVPSASGATVLPPLPSAGADTSFTSVPASGFNSQLGNNTVISASPASAKRDLRPPSNLALLLWLLALPFGLTAIGGQILLGRSRALLRI